MPYRTSFGMLTTRTGSPSTPYFVAAPPSDPFDGFRRLPRYRGTYSPSSSLGYVPPGRVSPTELRPLSGSADPPVPPRPLRTMAECRRPTAFAKPPLLAGNVPGYYPTLGGVYARLRLMSSPVIADPSRPPTHLHASIREGSPIPAHYTCRSRSPVGSEARDANPDFVHPPFGPARLSPGRVAGGC